MAGRPPSPRRARWCARADLRDVVVFTNGLKTALELEPAIERLPIVVLGGTLRRILDLSDV